MGEVSKPDQAALLMTNFTHHPAHLHLLLVGLDVHRTRRRPLVRQQHLGGRREGGRGATQVSAPGSSWLAPGPCQLVYWAPMGASSSSRPTSLINSRSCVHDGLQGRHAERDSPDSNPQGAPMMDRNASHHSLPAAPSIALTSASSLIVSLSF